MSQSQNFSYFFFYYKTQVLTQVSHKLFKRVKQPVLQVGSSKIRLFDCQNRKLAYNLVKEFVAEGLDTVTDVLAGFRILMRVLPLAGRVAHGMNNIRKFIFPLLQLVRSAYNLSSDFSVSNIISIVLDFLSLYECFNLTFEAESLDALVLAGVSYLLPAEFFSFLKRLTLVSNVKIGDDVNLFYQLISHLFDFIFSILDKVNAPSCFKTGLVSLLNFLKISSSHLILYEINALCDAWSANRKVILEYTYKEKIKALQAKYVKDMSIPDWGKKSQAIANIISKWDRLVKVVINSDKVNRVEPNCFILEGPPGCRKSVLSNLLCQALGERVYAHIVKAVTDGKDWYDNYNDEPIFFMDDVGAQGLSQWRTIINMVSCVKMPLDCAQAELKDTKYFSSTNIILTTNKFMTLCDVTKQDCISDITALYRRGYVFDLTKVKAGSTFLQGVIAFKHYDVLRKEWLVGFPKHFETSAFEKIPPTLVVKDETPRGNIVAWMVAIIKAFGRIKAGFAEEGELSTSELELVSDLVDEYSASYADATEQFLFNKPPQDDVKVSYDVVSDKVDIRLSSDKSSDQTGFNAESVLDFEIPSMFKCIIGAVWFVSTVNVFICDSFEYFITILSNFSSSFSDFVLDNSLFLMLGCFVLAGFVCLYFLKVPTPEERIVNTFNDFLNAVDFAGVPREQLAQVCNFCMTEKPSSLNLKNLAFACESFQSPFKYNTSVSSVFSSFFDITVFSALGTSTVKCFASGRSILVPFHCLTTNSSLQENYRVVVYSDISQNKRIIDHECVKLAYHDEKDDVAILQLPRTFPSPFKDRSKWFKKELDSSAPSFLINNTGVASLVGLNARPAQPNTYRTYAWSNTFGVTDLFYDTRGKGLCGSLVFQQDCGFVGMHVAGNAGTGVGVGKIWNVNTRESIAQIISSPATQIPFAIAQYKDSNSSVMKLGIDEELGMTEEEFRKIQASVPSCSKLVTTPLYGIYPVSRFPAQLSKYGKCTVKDVAKKSFSPLVPVDEKEMQFAIDTMQAILPEFSKITDSEVVIGNASLAALNKKSSNGFGCLPDKADYIDFDRGEFKEFFKVELDNIETQLKQQILPWRNFVWVESLKDELRGVEKEGLPRSFRVGTIHQQVLSKKYLGDLVQKLMSFREFNGIMVGVNPFIEWDNLAKKLSNYRLFAADVKQWDGGMLVQVQRAVVQEIVKKFRGTTAETKALELLLETIIHSLVIVQDDFYLTTHSLPSGHFLTAIFNSLVNRFYTAMWYYRQMTKYGRVVSVKQYFDDVLDLVYGDDKVVGVKNNFDILTARTMRDFFTSIGLGLTTSTKGEIDFDFQTLEEIDFLKRKFVFHQDLGRYMCPLELRTLYSGLSFVMSDKDMSQVLDDKINNIQRELFLHPDYDKHLEDLYSRLDKYKYPYLKLPVSYLRFLYTDQESLIRMYESLF